MAVSMRKGVQIGYGQRVLSPKDIANLAAWYDVSDGASLLKSNGSQVTTVGDTVALITDKSGNSATNVLCLNGVAGNYASASDSVPLSITGDIDVRAYVALDDWTPSAERAILTKYTSTGNQKTFLLSVISASEGIAGSLRLYWSEDGAINKTATSTAPVSVSDFGILGIRAALDINNGGVYNVTFYTSSDFVSWTQLGDVVVGASATSLFDSTSGINLGAYNSGANGMMFGRIYRAQIYNGINGTLVFDANFSTASKLATSFTESSSNAATVTINSSGATGARISGERDLVNLTAASQPTYLGFGGTQYGYLSGISGTYFSTPDSAAVSITGDIDIRCKIALSAWTTGAVSQDLVARWETSNQSYLFRVNSTGTLRFITTADGSTSVNAQSTAAVTFSSYQLSWVRVTRDVDNGAGGNTTRFYTSDDGTNWTQLGSDVVNVGTTSIFDGSAILRVSGNGLATDTGITGLVYRAQIYNGIAGTLAFDFNPATYVSGTTFLDSSSNAATITLNGGAAIVTKTCLYFDGSNDYAKSAAFSLNQPESIYFTDSQISWTSGDYLLDGNAANSGAIIQTTTTPQLNINAGSSVAANTGLGISIFGVLTAIFNAASSFLRVNRASSTSGNAGASNMSGLTVGASATPGNYGNIAMSELLVYSAAHDLTTQNLLITYEGAKWRINVAA